MMKPSLDDCTRLFGAGQTPEVYAERFLAWGVQQVVLTMGAAGVLLANAEGITYYPAQQVEVVDVTGAGDSFWAGLLVTDLGDNKQQIEAEQYIQSQEAQIGSALLPAFWPVIQAGDAGWRELESNHLYGQMKNMPYRYHNGGLWPMLTGLEIVGLVRHGAWDRASHLLTAINTANAQGDGNHRWEFAEYHDAQTHLPMGTKYMAWSAAAGVLAHQAVWRGISCWPT